MKPKRALIIGISGQDGAYLAKTLLEKGYVVHGTSRDAELSSFSSLKHFGIFDKVSLHSMSIVDFRSVTQTLLEVMPDEVYNLAGQTSVGLSFLQPVETLESISIGTLNILEVIRFHKLPIRFYNASSSECFGDCGLDLVNEESAFHPRSPYAVAKAAAFWQAANYREAYSQFVCSGILFNHDSPIRPPRFVTRKISLGANKIKCGLMDKLTLGNIEVKRDWGYAPEYCEGMWMMLQRDTPEDFVLATGETHSVREFIDSVFKYLDMDLEWRDSGIDAKAYSRGNGKLLIEIDPKLYRPSDIKLLCGDASKANIVLHWQARTKFNDLARIMAEHDFQMVKSSYVA